MSFEKLKRNTFDVTLLQVTQDRFNPFSIDEKSIIQRAKYFANKMVDEMDSLLNKNYKFCSKEQLFQADELHKLIHEKIEEAWEIYNKTVKDE